MYAAIKVQTKGSNTHTNEIRIDVTQGRIVVVAVVVDAVVVVVAVAAVVCSSCSFT